MKIVIFYCYLDFGEMHGFAHLFSCMYRCVVKKGGEDSFDVLCEPINLYMQQQRNVLLIFFF